MSKKLKQPFDRCDVGFMFCILLNLVTVTILWLSIGRIDKKYTHNVSEAIIIENITDEHMDQFQCKVLSTVRHIQYHQSLFVQNKWLS